MQVLKLQCVKCITAYKSMVNEPFQGTMPLEYCIRSCEMTVIKTMISLQAVADPQVMLKIAVCRSDLRVLALILVYLIENSLLTKVVAESDIMQLAI